MLCPLETAVLTWIKICFCQQLTLKGLSQCSTIVGVCRHLSFKVQIGLYFETKYLKISSDSCFRWLRYGQFFLGLGRKKMWKAHMLHLCFETKYLEVFKMLGFYAYLVPSMVIFLTLFVLVFLSFPFSCKSSSETVGLPLLEALLFELCSK